MSTTTTTVPQAKTVQVEHLQVTPAVGSYVILDAKLIGERRLPGDEPVDSGYAGCMFRWPVNAKPIDTVAVNVEVTGRTLQRKWGGYYVRVRITWVGDCEPDTHGSGWMEVKL